MEENQEQQEPLDHKGIIDQLIGENEKLREQIAGMKTSPISDAFDGMVLVIKQSDPMKLYIFACIGVLLLSAIVQLLEVFLK